MTRKPLGHSERGYMGWCQHSRGCRGPRKQCGGGRAGINRAMRRDGKAIIRAVLMEPNDSQPVVARTGARRYV